MNTGLKSYTKQFTNKIGNATVNVNLCKKDANLHIVLPLLVTKGLSPFATSLIYCYTEKDTVDMFGAGIKLDKYGKLFFTGGKLRIQNADGSIDTYSEGYFNDETNCKVSLIYDNSSHTIGHYEVVDRFGNKTIYGQSSNLTSTSDYPAKTVSKSGETLTLDFVNNDKKISNEKGDVIEFKMTSGTISQVTYKYNNTVMESVLLSYSGGNLTSLEYRNENNVVVAKTQIIYAANSITVIDGITDYRCVIQLSSNCVTSIKDGFGTAMTGAHTLTITYAANKTVVTSWDNTFVEYYFDSDGIPLYQMDSNGYVIETEYDSKTKLLKAQSSPFLINGSQQNYFAGKTMANFTLTNVTREKVLLTDSKWKSILGNSVYKFTHTGNTSGSIECEVPIDCVSTDSVTVILWGRQLTNFTDNSYVRVNMQIGNQDSDVFKKPQKDDEFELMLLGATCTRTENKVRILISFEGNVSIQLGGLQIVKQDFGTFYEYDAKNNMTLISKCGENAKVSYNSNNMPQEVTDFDTTIHTYEYNDKGRPTKSGSSYNVEIANEYNSTHPECLTKQTISNAAKTKIIETRRTFTTDGRHVLQEFDELGNCIATNTYQMEKLKTVSDALGTITEFTYANNGLIDNIIMRKNTAELAKAVYTYDVKRRLTSVTLKNGSKYEFVYDTQGNITSVKLNGTIVFSYTYDVATGNILSQKHGQNGDAYEFAYNTDHQVSKVTYVATSGTKSARFNYTYNNQKQLTKITDAQNVVLKTFECNDDGKITKVSNSDAAVRYSYDNLGKINNVSRTVNGKSLNASFENVSRSQSVHPQKLMKQFSYDHYVGMFEKDAVLTMGSVKLSPAKTTSFTVGREAALPYLDLKANQTLAYQLKDNPAGNNYERGCIKFWFKPTDAASKQFLFGVKSSNGDSYYSVYITCNRLDLEVREEGGKVTTLFCSDQSVKKDKWNFFALSFYYRDDGPSYGANCDIMLTVNSDTQIYTSTTKLLRIDVAPTPTYYIGRRYDGDVTNAFAGKIACVCISPRDFDTFDRIRYYYNVTKDFIEDCQYIDSASQTLDASETVAFAPSATTQNLFEVCPLHNSVVSTSGKRPTKFTRRDGMAEDKDKSFNFNTKAKRYAYVADGNELAYKFGQNSSGTILMRVYTETLRETQYLFEGKDSSGRTLGLFRDLYEGLFINYNGTLLRTDMWISNDDWHTVALSWDKSVTQSSMGDVAMGTYRLYIDGQTKTISNLCGFNDLEFAIGRRYDKKELTLCTGSSFETYPLYGQVEMLCASNAFCEVSVLNTLAQEIKCVTKTNEFDDFGMLKQSCLINGDARAMVKNISYATRTDNKYISKRIVCETFGLKNATHSRTYSYDKAGNVTKIESSMGDSHTYTYDERGFLTKEDTTTYNYDSNGNITKVGDTVMTYDTVIIDKLVKVGNTSITYDTKNPLNPSTYGDASYAFEGRRLVSFTKSGKTFTYKYDEQGLRTEKKSNIGAVTKFIYSGNKLITELAPSYQLDFLYDENDMLYGFIKDGTNKYFYIRDFLQNILGIIDGSGNLVVQYKQTAYGKVTVAKDTSNLATINPFRYKGYYFDQESGMYYCHTRYFVPDWCRWLNADDINYIKFDSFYQNHLFAYCGNNPIIGYDPDGTINWKSILKIAFSVVVVAALVTVAVVTAGTAVGVIAAGAAIGAGAGAAVGLGTGIANSIDEGGNWLDNIGDSMFSGTIIGACSGALAATGAGVGAQILGNMFFAGGEYLISSAIDRTNPTVEEFMNRLTLGLAAGVFGGNGLRYFEVGVSGIVKPVIRTINAAVSSLIQAIGASNIGDLLTDFIIRVKKWCS